MTDPLCPAAVLAIGGRDAIDFAHAQFSTDVKSLAAGRWHWSAWLDPHGRVRTFFALLRVEPARLLAWLPLGDAAAMSEALSRFRLRSAVQLEAQAWALHATQAPMPAAAPGDIVAIDDGLALLLPGARVAWLTRGIAGSCDAARLNAWRLADIDAGLPLLPAPLAGEFLPQALDLERLDAIRFDKGCYPGQEIAARVHFRGGNKRALRRVRMDGTPPPSGTRIMAADGRVAGTILYAADRSEGASAALAVLATDPAVPEALAIAGDRPIEICA